MSTTSATPFGHALRRWRDMRHLSQLQLAMRAGTPSRHVSFLETGRARPSREMVLRLADALDVPPEACNTLLSVAGFAPAFSERPLSDDALGAVRDVIGRLLRSHAPYPGLVLNAWYDVVDMNDPARALFGALDLEAVAGVPNLVTLLLGPLRRTIVNWEEVMLDTRDRLRGQVSERPADARLTGLLASVDEVVRSDSVTQRGTATDSPVLFTHFRTAAGNVRTLSTLVQFGSARDITVHGLHVELIYPADADTDALLTALGTSPVP